MTGDKLNQISHLAATVAAQHQATSTARTAALAAEAAVLEALVDLVAPALPALASQIRLGATYRIDRESGRLDREDHWLLGTRGIALSAPEGPAETWLPDGRIGYRGQSVVLTAERHWLLLTYSGAADTCGRGGWTSTLTELPDAAAALAAKLTPEAAADQLLAKLLSHAQGGMAKRERTFTAQAERLSAILTLLRAK